MELMPDFRLHRPASIAETVALRAALPAARLLAGGTDLLPAMRRGLVDAADVIDLTRVAGLAAMEPSAGGLRIGAATTLATLAASQALARDYPVLVQAALAVAGPTHRASATLGGNLCLDTRCRHFNQSERWRESNHYCLKLHGDGCRVARKSKRCYAAFSGDLAPALLVLGAEAEICSARGTRRIALAQMYADDGLAHLRLAGDELLAAVHVPAPTGLRAAYRKARTRKAVDFAVAGVALGLRTTGSGSAAAIDALAIACTGANSAPLAIAGLEELHGRTIAESALLRIDELVEAQLKVMETSVVSSLYRRRVTLNLIRRLLAEMSSA